MVYCWMQPGHRASSSLHAKRRAWKSSNKKKRNIWTNDYSFAQARKRHINIIFFVRLVPVFTGFVPGTNPVCPWDKSGEKQGQTQEFSLFYTVEARFHRVCPWDKPGLSQGQSRGRRAAQKVYVKKVYVPFSLAIRCCFCWCCCNQAWYWSGQIGCGCHMHAPFLFHSTPSEGVR